MKCLGSEVLFCFSTEQEKRHVIELLKKNFIYTYRLNKRALNRVNNELYLIRRGWEWIYYSNHKQMKVLVLAFRGSLNDLDNVKWKLLKPQQKEMRAKFDAFSTY